MSLFKPFIIKSERRGSNSRPAAWKAAALPTELLSLKMKEYTFGKMLVVGRAGFEPAKTRSADLQSALVGRLSISPTNNSLLSKNNFFLCQATF